jgi:thiamine-monophosphate kinase
MRREGDGEFQLITRYFCGLTSLADDVVYGIGDDAAVVSIPAGYELVVSADTLVSDVHFPAGTDPYDIGFKALAVNLSDLAAMGAEPRWVTLCLTLPGVDNDWLAKFSRGFADPANRYNVCLVGGDTTRGPLSISVQIMGIVRKGTAISRGGARAGDHIFVTGELGAAALALSLLKDADARHSMDDCLARLNRPEPRVEVGRALTSIASAMIDISDGLAADLGHLLENSGVSAFVEPERVPVCRQLQQVKDRNRYWQLAFASGDDYELCFTAPEESVQRLEAISNELQLPITDIGRIVEGEGRIKWVSANGEEMRLSLRGYRHF